MEARATMVLDQLTFRYILLLICAFLLTIFPGAICLRHAGAIHFERQHVRFYPMRA